MRRCGANSVRSCRVGDTPGSPLKRGFGAQVSELQEDISDMKTIFHKELNEAVNQLEAARAALKPNVTTIAEPAETTSPND